MTPSESVLLRSGIFPAGLAHPRVPLGTIGAPTGPLKRFFFDSWLVTEFDLQVPNPKALPRSRDFPSYAPDRDDQPTQGGGRRTRPVSRGPEAARRAGGGEEDRTGHRSDLRARANRRRPPLRERRAQARQRRAPAAAAAGATEAVAPRAAAGSNPAARRVSPGSRSPTGTPRAMGFWVTGTRPPLRKAPSCRSVRTRAWSRPASTFSAWRISRPSVGPEPPVTR